MKLNKDTQYRYMGGVAMRCLLLLLCGSLPIACINRFEEASSDSEPIDVSYNITLERLHALVPTTTTSYFDVATDLVIRGSVTATDESGNFYKSFVIEQDGYAVEILEGLTYSYVRHEEGCEMVVKLDGLRLSRSSGVMQVGLASSSGSYYDLDYLGHELIVDSHIINTGYVSYVEPLSVSRSELDDEDLVERLAGSLVSIAGLTLVRDDESGNTTLWGGTLEFVDSEERTVGCYTSDYADFSMCAVPEGELTLQGILQYDYSDGASSPMIKLRAQSDCIVME